MNIVGSLFKFHSFTMSPIPIYHLVITCLCIASKRKKFQINIQSTPPFRLQINAMKCKLICLPQLVIIHSHTFYLTNFTSCIAYFSPQVVDILNSLVSSLLLILADSSLFPRTLKKIMLTW